MTNEVQSPRAEWKNYIVTEGDESQNRDECLSFQEYVRMPLKKKASKDQYVFPRISDKHQFLPDLMSKQAKISNAAKQWDISQETNMTNSFQINKIVSQQRDYVLQNIKFSGDSHTLLNSQLRGLKLSFRKRVIDPTPAASPSVKIGKNLPSSFFVNREQTTANYSVMDPQEKAQGSYRKGERKLVPLTNYQLTMKQSRSMKQNC